MGHVESPTSQVQEPLTDPGLGVTAITIKKNWVDFDSIPS